MLPKLKEELKRKTARVKEIENQMIGLQAVITQRKQRLRDFIQGHFYQRLSIELRVEI